MRAGAAPAAAKGLAVGEVVVSWVVLEGPMDVTRDEGKEAIASGVLVERLASDGRVRTGVEGRPALELAVIEGRPGSGEKSAGSRISLRTTWGDGWRLIATKRADATTSGSVDRADLARIVDGLIDDLVGQVALFGMDSAALVEMLRADPSSGKAVTAVRILGERGFVDAVPLLVEMLDEAPLGSEMVPDLVGALGRIGDPRATPALIAVFHEADPGLDVAIVDALGRTGGKEASDFLQVLESGHPSRVVRDEASDGLRRLEKRPAVE